MYLISCNRNANSGVKQSSSTIDDHPTFMVNLKGDNYLGYKWKSLLKSCSVLTPFEIVEHYLNIILIKLISLDLNN